MIKTEFSFGEEIIVTGDIKRNKWAQIREWKQFAHEARPALFLNGIHLANGTIETEYYDEEGSALVFNSSELIKGAWICEKNRAPRKVFLSDCHKKEIK